MNPALLIAGITIALLAMLVLLFFAVAPPAPRIARDRRLAPGEEHVSGLTRIANRTVSVLDSAASKRTSRMFGPEELSRAGLTVDPPAFLVFVGSAASVLALIGALLGLSSGTSVVLALVFAAVTPLLAKAYLIARTSKRRAKFAEQVDDTVQMIAGGLRAGHGLSRALGAVAAETDSPMREELSRVVNETRLGRSLADSLATTAQRMSSPDFEWVAQAISINQETGGNLAEVLDQVGKTIRERNEIRRQVSALSAEGRLSAIILVALPIVVFFLLLATRPSYVSVLFQTVLGIISLVVAFVLMIVGIIWVSFAVKVKF
ncbi:type II secretion system F family protein [Agromyces sp. NPDC057679]|uniref:type II secretion system F family protein n=1 Tax=Agromyces sp. NPDC057679 TaxID=3346207 RepID=UPI003671775E